VVPEKEHETLAMSGACAGVDDTVEALVVTGAQGGAGVFGDDLRWHVLDMLAPVSLDSAW